jgi:hypothetical protein
LLSAILILSAVLRFYKLGEWSYWYDEIYTVNRVTANFTSLPAIFGRQLPGVIWFPISLILTGQAFNFLGVSEFSGRLAPALIGIASIPILYVPFKRLLGTHTALLCCLLLAVSPWHLFWSQNARFYVAMMLFTTLSLLSFYHAFENDRPWYIVIGYLFLYLGASERLTAFLAYPVAFAYLSLLLLFPKGRPVGLTRKNVLLFLSPIGVYLLAEFLFQLIGADFFVADAFRTFSRNRGPDPFRLVHRIILSIGVPLACFSTFSGLYLLMQKNRLGLLLTLMATLPIATLAILNQVMFTETRYAFIVLPGWIMLSGLGVRSLFRRMRLAEYGAIIALAVPMLLLSDAVFADMLYFQAKNGNRLDWRAAFSLVDEHRQNDDVVVSHWPALGNYYSEATVTDMRKVDRQAVLTDNRRYWFVIDDITNLTYFRFSTWIGRNCSLRYASQMFLEQRKFLNIYRCDPEQLVATEDS